MWSFRSVSLTLTSAFLTIALTFTGPVRAQHQSQPTELTGLIITKIERTRVEGQDGIEITFDARSAERLREFTSGGIGRTLEFVVDQKKLATLRVIDPLTDGNVLLTGQVDAALISPSATVSVKFK